MKKLNRKGFTLIELLAVITIMGILMLVAIPAVSRTIENSRRDTFADVAKTYINTIRNAVLADELSCAGVSSGATADGTYYYEIDSADPDTQELMESGGVSSWGNAAVTGYVKWVKTTTSGATASDDQRIKTTYYVYLVDEGSHGIAADNGLLETQITRRQVSTKTTKGYSDFIGTGKTKAKPTKTSSDTKDPVKCTLK